jgi:hypothetical protein
MQERERIVVSSLVVLLLALWLGFLWHQAPRFAGSVWGGALGVSAALLLLWPLVYALIKRVPALKAMVTRRVQLRTLLAWHVYTSMIGALLALFHTGHKFTSPLGIALTATMFVAVLSGFVGRHLLGLLSHELQERRTLLEQLRVSYAETAAALATKPEQALLAGRERGLFARLSALFLTQSNAASPDPEGSTLVSRALPLVESIAEVEYAVTSDTLLQRQLARWLAVHLVVSAAFYGLLAIHIGAGIYYGLRWTQP